MNASHPLLPPPPLWWAHPWALATRWLGRARRLVQPPLASDWALWQQACGGDPDSAVALVRQLTPTALALARQVLGRAEDAEDVVQEAFLRLWSARPQDRGDARLATYFNTIVLNRCRSLLVRRRELSVEPDELATLHEAMADGGAAEPWTETATSEQLQAALARLPARQRLALALWAYADAEVPAIAAAMELETNAAHQLLHRARRNLRTMLETRA